MRYAVRWEEPETHNLQNIQFEDKSAVFDFIRDRYADEIDDAFDSYIPQACGVFPDPFSMETPILESAYNYLKNILDEQRFSIIDLQEESTHDELTSILLRSFVEDCVNSSDASCQYIGPKVLEALSQFISKGKWQWGYLDGDTSKPILWFGLVNERPFSYWIISKEDESFEQVLSINGTQTEKWKSCFGFAGGFDWNLLIDDSRDCDIFFTWVFVEFGMDEPDITPVISSCPIEITASDTKEELCHKIDKLFSATQGQIKWSLSYLRKDYSTNMDQTPVKERVSFSDEFGEYIQGNTPDEIIDNAISYIGEIMQSNCLDVKMDGRRISVFTPPDSELTAVYEDFFAIMKFEE